MAASWAPVAATQRWVARNKEHNDYKNRRDIGVSLGLAVSIAGSVLLFAAYGIILNIPGVDDAVKATLVDEMGLAESAHASWKTAHLAVAIAMAGVPFVAWIATMFFARPKMQEARQTCTNGMGFLAKQAGTEVRNWYIAIIVFLFLSAALVAIYLVHVWAYALPASEGDNAATENAVYFFQISLAGLLVGPVGHLVMIGIDIYLAIYASYFCTKTEKLGGAQMQPMMAMQQGAAQMQGVPQMQTGFAVQNGYPTFNGMQMRQQMV